MIFIKRSEITLQARLVPKSVTKVSGKYLWQTSVSRAQTLSWQIILLAKMEVSFPSFFTLSFNTWLCDRIDRVNSTQRSKDIQCTQKTLNISNIFIFFCRLDNRILSCHMIFIYRIPRWWESITLLGCSYSGGRGGNMHGS